MTSDPHSVAESDQESVVIASFDGHRDAERMLASLGRGFRKKARKGGTSAVVIGANTDGSLKLTQSRVTTASDLGYILMSVSLAWSVGLMGILSMFKGAKGEVHSAHVRQGHLRADALQAREILAEAGPHAAITLVRCKDQDTRHMVVAAAGDRARRSWDGSLTDFLAALDPGPTHDWVRAALGEPTSTNRR
ncbi:hypothetical protein ABT330_15195 [Streptomyces sp. NPDC000658]|uniref:hypothetical protein n=1 Tax=Streptomyces sp. NPDC000658 TaxID=3154266 RepID=UPI003332FABE